MSGGMLAEIMEVLEAMPEDKMQALVKEVSDATKSLNWVPNPGPQTDAYYCDADELFYGGQAGGGKTDLIVGLSLTSHKRSLVLRRTNKEAEKLPDRYEEVLGNKDGFNSQKMTWRFGDRLIDIGGCQLESDKQKRKGIPHDLKAFDEISDFSESQYTFIIAWNRSADKKQRCRVLCTGNPPTTAEGFWVIKRWGAWLDPTHPNPAKDGELRWYTTINGKDTEVDGPGPHLIEGEEVYARSRTFIRARLSDNPDLEETNYDAVLAALPERERLAYRDGRFDASMVDALGQAIPTQWIRMAQERWRQGRPEGVPMCAIGVDMTGGGSDPMVLAPRYDGYFDSLVEIPASRFDIERLSSQAAGEIVAVRRNKALVVIDLGGGYGSGTYEWLKENDVETYGYKGSRKSPMRAKESNIPFKNDRTAAYWRLREALDPSQPGGSRIALPDDPELVADLTAPTYKVVNNTYVLEAKEKVVERLGRSTDKGDAVAMSWFQGAREETAALDWIEQAERHKKRGQAPKVISGRHNARR